MRSFELSYLTIDGVGGVELLGLVGELLRLDQVALDQVLLRQAQAFQRLLPVRLHGLINRLG